MAKNGGAAYDGHKKATGERQRRQSAEGRDIGEIPPPVDVARRNRGLDDPEFFHRTYFPSRYYLPFGAPQCLAIRAYADCTENGGLFALAMMRGGGKTSLAETEVIRAVVYAIRRYVTIFGATDGLANNSVRKIYREFETNDLLMEDFPEICYPIRALERITQRARGQTCMGKSTGMEIGDGQLVLPTTPGSPSSGAVIQAFGLTGALKGLSVMNQSGEVVRPDLALIDDAQTRESAGSPTQTDKRERIIADDIMGLAGPRTKMAAVFLCTPIYPNDLTERFIDRDRHPEWKGVRTRMVERFPTDTRLWDGYAELRRESLRGGDEGARATEYYSRHRAEMDAGCALAWPDRVKDGDVSGVQTAMNLSIDNPTGFRSEYQCEPESNALGQGAKELVSTAVAARFNGVERFEVPSDCTRLTAFIDCGHHLLWYCVCAWTESFGGSVIDYGVFPRQTRGVFSKSDPRPGMAYAWPDHSPSQRVFAGLEALAPEILGRAYYRQNGGQEMKVERCLIDSGDGETVQAVYQFVAKSPQSGILYPSKGVGRSNTAAGVAKWVSRPGERSGFHWRLTTGERGRGRLVQFDPDAWKTFVHSAMQIPPGGDTGLRLFGKSATAHELFGEHMASEYSEPKPHRGDVFDKWEAKANRPDNDWFDCLVGCAVAASVQGLVQSVSLGAKPTVASPAPPKRKGSDIQREKMAKRNAG